MDNAAILDTLIEEQAHESDWDKLVIDNERLDSKLAATEIENERLRAENARLKRQLDEEDEFNDHIPGEDY